MQQATNSESDRRILASDQHADTYLSTLINERIQVRLCSVRCQEAQEDGTPNQDYARVIVTPSSRSLSFCVCDGVGSSYLGDFAARALAIRLTGMLLDLPAIPENPSTLEAGLREHLGAWAAEAHYELRRLAFPPALSSLEREILEEQRDQYGSMTVFLCGRIDDLPSSDSPKAGDSLLAFFCWMGNVTGRTVLADSSRQDLGDLGDDRNRWSTRHGPLGTLSLRTCHLGRTEPLLVHTDGLDALTHELADLDHQQLQERMQDLLRLPTSDDMTVLEVRWRDEELTDPAGEKDGMA